jgi:hypothetical protein
VAAEARYLGLLVAATLLAALHAAPRIGTLLGAAAVLLGAIPWALPGTPDRGAAVGLLLAGVLAIAAAPAGAIAAIGSGPGAIRPQALAALAIGAQILVRGGDLLAPTTAAVIGVVAWAGVATAAVFALAARRGAFAASLAGASAFLLGPGFTPTSALALAVPALALLAADRERAPLTRIAAVAGMLAPLALDFERGALLAAGAIAFAGPAWARWTAGLAGLAAFFAPGAERTAGLDGPAWLLLALPIVVTEPRTETATRFAAICLALGAAAQSPDHAVLAVPAVLVAATVAGARPLAAAIQATWTGVLAVAVAVLAAYPWLREDALHDAAAILGLGDGWRAAIATLLLLAAVAAASRLFARGSTLDAEPAQPVAAAATTEGPARSPHARRSMGAAATLAPRALAILLAALALARHAPTAATPISRQPVELDARTPTWGAPLEPPARVSALRLDSTLSHSAAIPAGTVIAEVRLATADGERVVPVRAGIDTGEWAARRDDVAAIAGFVAPEPFLHWVDAGGGFFGQRYRAHARLDWAATATAIEVRLAPGVPSDLTLTLFHLELSR